MARSGKAAVWRALAMGVWLSAGAAPADVLVTTGGSRHRGEVSREGNTYVVVKPDGGRIVLPATMVREVIAEAAAPRPAKVDTPPTTTAKATAPASPSRPPATRPATVLKGRRVLLVGGFTFAQDPPSLTGQAWVADALRRVGAVPVQDFAQLPQLVVLGVPVSRPQEPGDGAGAQAVAAYKKELDAWRESPAQIAQARKQAAERSIQVLSHDAFMAALGEAVERQKADQARSRPPTSVGEARLRQRLPRVSFRDSKLADCIQFFRDAARVSIYVDYKSLEAEGVGPDTPVSLELKDVAAAAALKMVLKATGKGDVRHAVDWASVVVISSPDGLKRMLAGGPKEWTAPRNPTGDEEAVARKLMTPFTRVNFNDIRAEDVFSFFRDFSGVTMTADWQQLAPAGLERTTLISLNLTDAPIGRAIELAFRAHGAKLIIRGKTAHLVPAEQ